VENKKVSIGNSLIQNENFKYSQRVPETMLLVNPLAFKSFVSTNFTTRALCFLYITLMHCV